MDNNDAKLILQVYRSSGEDASDPFSLKPWNKLGWIQLCAPGLPNSRPKTSACVKPSK